MLVSLTATWEFFSALRIVYAIESLPSRVILGSLKRSINSSIELECGNPLDMIFATSNGAFGFFRKYTKSGSGPTMPRLKSCSMSNSRATSLASALPNGKLASLLAPAPSTNTVLFLNIVYVPLDPRSTVDREPRAGGVAHVAARKYSCTACVMGSHRARGACFAHARWLGDAVVRVGVGERASATTAHPASRVRLLQPASPRSLR